VHLHMHMRTHARAHTHSNTTHEDIFKEEQIKKIIKK
jgi:hypothetical protein